MQPSTYLIPDSKEDIVIDVRRCGDTILLWTRSGPLTLNSTKGLSQRDAIALSNALSAVALGGFERAVSHQFLLREKATEERWRSRSDSAGAQPRPTLEQL